MIDIVERLRNPAFLHYQAMREDAATKIEHLREEVSQ